MESYRIINFIMQTAYLAGHLLFILALVRRRQPTPVWRWFFWLCVTAWLWVSGRLMESVVYLWFPGDNEFYRFAANYQYLGNTAAASTYVIWTLYLDGRDRLASSGWFRALIFASPVIICTLVFTNPWHRLFYTKLDMGERVAHGPLFLPCVLWTYGLLLAGYLISIRFVLRTERDRARQIVMFSAFPILPAVGVMIRSLTGIDRLDYTPGVMAAGIICLYLCVFSYRYINLVSAPVREIIEQSAHPIGIYDPGKGEFSYLNRIAKGYPEIREELLPRLSGRADSFEGEFGGRHLSVETAPLTGGGEMLVTVTDTSDLAREQAGIEEQIREQESVQAELDEAKRNIDAYLELLLGTGDLRRKQELVAGTRAMVKRVYDRVAENLEAAGRDPQVADGPLRENLELTRDCIASIRRTVADLREG